MMPKPVIRRKHLFDQFVSVTDGELIIISWGPGDRDWGTETGDQRGMNGSRSKFLSKSIRRPISRKSPQTLNLRYENSYGLAISQQHTLENFTEAKEPTRCESQNTAEGTGQTAHWDRSDRSGWSRRPRPVKPVSQTGQTGRSQTAHNQSSKWQISSKRSPNPTKLGG